MNYHPREGLPLVGTEFGKQVKFSTSFGLEDQVITHMIASAKLEIEVFTLDTGRLFQETYDVFALTKQKIQSRHRSILPTTIKG